MHHANPALQVQPNAQAKFGTTMHNAWSALVVPPFECCMNRMVHSLLRSLGYDLHFCATDQGTQPLHLEMFEP